MNPQRSTSTRGHRKSLQKAAVLMGGGPILTETLEHMVAPEKVGAQGGKR